VASPPPSVRWSGWKRSAFAQAEGRSKSGRAGHAAHPASPGQPGACAPRSAGNAPGAATPQSPDLIIGDRGLHSPKGKGVSHRRGENHTQGTLPLSRIVKDEPLGRIIGLAGREYLRIPIQPVTTQRHGRDRRGRRRSCRCMSLAALVGSAVPARRCADTGRPRRPGRRPARRSFASAGTGTAL